jgi:hypothetical protein
MRYFLAANKGIDAGACFSRRQELLDLHQKISTFNSDTSGLLTSHDRAPPLQPDVVSAHEQPDPTTESLPVAHCFQKGAPRHTRPKHHLSSASAGLATVSSPAFTLHQSTNLEILQSHASATDSSQERQPCDIDDGSIDDPGDEDYANYSDASSNAIDRPRPLKRLKRSKDLLSTTYHDIERDSSCLLELSNQDLATTLSIATPQSEDIPIRGFLTLKAFESKVIYYLSFSQELSLQLGGTSVYRSGDRRDSEQSPLQEQATSSTRQAFEIFTEDDKLLQRLKEDEFLS